MSGPAGRGQKKKTGQLPAQAIRGIFFWPPVRTVLATVRFSPAGRQRRGRIFNPIMIDHRAHSYPANAVRH